MLDLLTAGFVLALVSVVALLKWVTLPRVVIQHLDHDFQRDVLARLSHLETSNRNRMDAEITLHNRIDEVDEKVETLIATDELVMMMWPDVEAK